MENVVLVIHLILALSIIGLVLLQRSEGGGLGIGGGRGGGLGNIASGRSMDNVLTKATTICAVAFFGTSLFLGVLAKQQTSSADDVLKALESQNTITESIEAEETQDIPLAVDPEAQRQTPQESDIPAVPLSE